MSLNPHRGKSANAKQFVAYAKVDSKTVNLGYFSTAVPAAQAYDQAVLKRDVSFRRLVL